VLVTCLLAPPAANAQEAASNSATSDRERWALVGIWTPGLKRIGLLIPLGERLLIRPDIQGYAWSSEGISEGWYANPGISVIVRTRPVDGSWAYASLRATQTVDVYEDWEDWSNSFTLTAGAHATVTRMFGVFGEAGIGYTYDEDGPDDPIYRTYDFVSRFGFALSRAPKR
jgi:hypothetical protein